MTTFRLSQNTNKIVYCLLCLFLCIGKAPSSLAQKGSAIISFAPGIMLQNHDGPDLQSNLSLKLGYHYRFARFFGMEADAGFYSHTIKENITLTNQKQRLRISIMAPSLSVQPKFYLPIPNKDVDIYLGTRLNYYRVNANARIISADTGKKRFQKRSHTNWKGGWGANIGMARKKDNMVLGLELGCDKLNFSEAIRKIDLSSAGLENLQIRNTLFLYARVFVRFGRGSLSN